MNECEAICKKKRCGTPNLEESLGQTTEVSSFGCGSSQPSYLKDKLGIKIRWDSYDEEKEDTNTNFFSAQDALEILRKISRHDVEMLGLDPGLLKKYFFFLD